MVEIHVLRIVAEEDLHRIGRQDIPRVLKKIALLEVDVHAGYPLGGEPTGFRKLVVGRNTYRIVYRIRDDQKSVDICEIWAVRHRRDSEVYREASRRVRRAASARPELLSLAELMATLDRFDAEVRSVDEPPADPVPDWLFTQLVQTAGVPPQEVAAMTGAEAFAAWNEWMSRPR
jgi:mRNA interferase RelE/StbE